MNPLQAASALAGMDSALTARLLAEMQPRPAARVLAAMESDRAGSLMETMALRTPHKAVPLLTAMDMTKVFDLVNATAPSLRSRIMQATGLRQVPALPTETDRNTAHLIVAALAELHTERPGLT
ncbi:hypothetical protein ACWT_3835 [Actinoplanes sp. SE50]|nr:hypothetical protein ACPL_3964 [Actinoplanes sp. SE50/110]ATO83250.1 hypothetical protein ACWT_3835 [Actinoplanes sp. SE50]SLM00657.1 hypothetical protein ACSP50_3890 [Actinoplanes sp. SE50/110]